MNAMIRSTDSRHASAILILIALATVIGPGRAEGQSADWQGVVWREPQVRYLVADMELGGDTVLYRKYANEERDPDSREALRLWDNGARVLNRGEFERKWVRNPMGKDGRVMRVVFRGTDRTISGAEVLLTTDRNLQRAAVRVILAGLTLGVPRTAYEPGAADSSVAEALRRWDEGGRATGTAWFALRGGPAAPRVVYKGTDQIIDGSLVRLNSDVAYSETNVRYFLADMALGGSRLFYVRAGEAAHETACLEAVARLDAGVSITNLNELERKQVVGKTLVTRKGTDERIRGMDVKLSSD